MYAGPYCYWCGKHTKQEPTGRFDTKTGEPVVTYRCVDDCKHGNHRYVSKSRLGGLIVSHSCAECGKSLDAEGIG